ncbi:MAG: hypothetical protein JRH11_13420, partial [Deltaproteobacteria bacterium]|nr:hypothetical protein [Deltaproteobacteria bacterium]
MSVERTVTAALVLISSIIGSPVAYGQSAPDPESPREAPVDAGDVGEEPVADAATECSLHEHYDRAFELYADGAYVEAQALLEEVLATCPDLRGAADLLRHARERAAQSGTHLGDPAAVPAAASNYGDWVPIPAAGAAGAAGTAGTTGNWERPPAASATVAPGEGEQESDLARVELSIVEGLMG